MQCSKPPQSSLSTLTEMPKIIFLIPLALWAASATAQPTTTSNASILPLYEDKQAYELYSAVLSKQSRNAINGITTLVTEQTITGDSCVEPNGPLAEKIREADDERHRLDKQPYRLANKFTLHGPSRLLMSEGEKDAQAQLQLDDPGVKRLSAITTFSAVGFSKDRQVAVLFARTYCGALCGWGRSFVFVKKGAQWTELAGQLRCSTDY